MVEYDSVQSEGSFAGWDHVERDFTGQDSTKPWVLNVAVHHLCEGNFLHGQECPDVDRLLESVDTVLLHRTAHLVEIAFNPPSFVGKSALEAFTVTIKADRDVELEAREEEAVEALRVHGEPFEAIKNAQVAQAAAKDVVLADAAAIVKTCVVGGSLAVETLEEATRPVVLLQDRDAVSPLGQQDRRGKAGHA